MRQRAYSPSRPFDRRETDYDSRGRREASPPRRSPPRRYDERRDDGRYDDRVPPPRRYDDNDRVPPPRHYDDDRVPPPRRHEDDRDRARRHDDNSRRYDDDRRRSPPRREERYRDRDRDRGEESYDRQDRGGKDRDAPSAPSRDVIFLGLDPELTENELAGFLRAEHSAPVESAKIVRDRNGVSKCFGFAMFATLPDAELFMQNNFPLINMPALYPHSSAKRVKIDFAGARGDGGEGPRPPAVRGHDGTRDIGQPDGLQRVLLLRGLDPGTFAGEVSRRVAEEIARMIGKGVREAEATITRVVMIVDRESNTAWSFAFVELVTPELATALLPFLLTPQHQPNGFLISQVPIAASFANPAAFIPTPAGPLGSQYLIRAAPNGGIGAATIDYPDGEWCAYWHQSAAAVETLPRGAPPIPARGTSLVLPDETREFLGKLAGASAVVPGAGFAPVAAAPPGTLFTAVTDSGSAAVTTAPSGSAPAPLLANAMQPIKIGINIGGAAGVKKKAKLEDGLIPITQKNVLGEDEDEQRDPGRDSVLLSRTKGAKIIPPTSSSRKIAKNINKWNTKQTELAKPVPAKNPHAPPRAASSANTVAVGTRPAASASPTPSTQDDFDYTDTSTHETTGKVACLLCQRQFKAEDILRKHVAVSELHKTNLADPSVREAGKQRKEAASGSSEPKYRDRAAERREVFHQADMPVPEPYRKAFKRQPSTTAAPPAPAPPPPPAVPATDESNVGNKLLAKMGWTAGSGLGAAADGRVDPIKVQQFEERAGLGAAKPREAGKWSGPGGWQERKKDMTKERYDAANT